jgi:hypothetical protein
MQNEALLLAQSQADSATKKNSELYDLLPSGYFTLNKGAMFSDLIWLALNC